jgi:2-dehydropantoate 2-reductase
MACYFGARLARSGATRVTLAGTWREGLDAVATRGIHVEDGDGAWAVRVYAAPLAEAPVAALSLVLTKSQKTTAVAPAVARAVGDAGIALSLQNGLGNREALESCVRPGAVLAGVTMAGATLLGPGHVRGHDAPTILGRDEAGRAHEVAALFHEAGFQAEVSPNIEAVLWRKLVVNSAINPLSALKGVPNGALVENPEWRGVLEEAAREAATVAAARGIDVGNDPVEAALEVARLTAANRSSMLQDLERGAPTEIDAINGMVVREGARLGVPTPVNRRLLDEIRAREEALGTRHGASS